ncbi:MAG: hypothetical protein CR991_10910 [Proteobacteria bacterium]|nr:MAG: hypothetical protein CR991_10910 [Pseudomonadota bacterium]
MSQVKAIPMHLITYQLIKYPFGYKVEYDGKQALFIPREHVITTRLSVQTHPTNPVVKLPATYTLHPLNPDRQAEYIATFFAVFKNTVEFCAWSPSGVHQTAVNHIEGFFAGKRGQPHPASVMTLQTDGSTDTNGSLAGLALVVTNTFGETELDLLYVMPDSQRRQVAHAMLQHILKHLRQTGEETLRSTRHICNEASRNWHAAMGFQDDYDWLYVRLKCAWYQREIWRHLQLGWTDELENLQSKLAYWRELEEHFKKSRILAANHLP